MAVAIIGVDDDVVDVVGAATLGDSKFGDVRNGTAPIDALM